jgi:hypothetical protein
MLVKNIPYLKKYVLSQIHVDKIICELGISLLFYKHECKE